MDKVAAIIVTYNPDVFSMEKSIRSIKNNGVAVIIIDNSERETVFPDNMATVIVSLGSNFGIAKAQNIGVKKALDLGYEWFVFFDQDSVIANGFIDQLMKNSTAKNPYVAAPVFCDNEKKFYYYLLDIDNRGRRRKIHPKDVTEGLMISTVISSGMVMNKLALECVGNMCEDLFIDYVDTEWCLRAASRGIKIEVMKDAVMKHSIGDRSVSLFGYRVPIHGYQRRYYRVRNGFTLLTMKHVPKKLAIREIIFSFIHQVVIILSEKNSRLKYIKSYLIAVHDGLQHKVGKCSHEI